MDSEIYSFELKCSEKIAREFLIDIEKSLRNCIDYTLGEKYGSNWEINSKCGFEDNELNFLKSRKKEEQQRFSNQKLSDKLIDYCYLLDLKKLVDKNWLFFIDIFDDKKKTILLMDILSLLRNPIIHRPNDVLPYQFCLCIGICGEFGNKIEKWKFGFKSKIKIIECALKFGEYKNDVEYEDDYDLKVNTLKLSDNWLNKIKEAYPDDIETISEDDNMKILLLRFPGEGTVKIIMMKEPSIREYNNNLCWESSIRLRTDNIVTLDKILSISNHPYWILTLELRENLDLGKIKDKIEEETGDKSWKIGGKLKEKTPIPHIIDRMIDSFDDASISIKIYNNQDGNGSIIQVIYNSKSDPTKGFFSAHRLLSIQNIMSILYGEMTPTKKHQLFKNACI